jgi:hypothetical protein
MRFEDDISFKMTKILLGLLISILLVSCKHTKPKLFSLLDKGDTGIDFRNILQEDSDMNVMNYSYFYNGGGVAIGDINNDGLQDILFTGNMVKNRLYLNKGNLKFEDITAASGIADNQGWCTGATMVDINGDGNLDIYICRSADVDPDRRKNLLLINNGNLTFTERAAEFGLDDSGYSTQASFFDYDKDGDLDMFLINHSLQEYSTGAQENPELRTQKNPNFANKLYQNNKGRFKNVSDGAGITSNVLTFGLGLAVSDVNLDGWLDIYVSNDFNEPDYLFINNRNGTFTDELSKRIDQISMYSMGSDFADFNNDGLTDLITLDMLAEDNVTQKMHSGSENFDKMQFLFKKGFFNQFSRNMLQKNNGDGTFSEIGQFAGVSNTDWSWAALFSDFDNDGYKDLFISNGYVKDYTDMDFLKYTVDQTIRVKQGGNQAVVTDYIKQMPTIEIPNYIFKNNGQGSFDKCTSEWGLDQNGVSAGAAYADLDNDGDMDLVVNNTNAFAGIYKNNNESLSKSNYIRLHLKGTAANPFAIGARISVFSGGHLSYQEQMPVRGFQSSVDPILNFGLGKRSRIDSMVIVWPDDRRQVLKNVKVNQLLTVNHSNAIKVESENVVGADKYLALKPSLQFTHEENEYNDFNVQGLMTNYLSRQGPCIAKGDLNGDHMEDLFIGGAAGQTGRIFLQSANGSFTYKASQAIDGDIGSEDTAAEFFDVDGDGDLDLYVGSGGYEFDLNDDLLQDRIYLNDGKGNFKKKQSGLPKLLVSTGTVKSCDIDQDGDMDFFVGGRVSPGRYPEAPDSKLYINNGKGDFTDATARLAPGLANLGMITGAVWLDLNGDKSDDLVVVGEWMPIKVFINRKGKLADESAAYIKFGSSGWWNTVAAEDLDGDGDKDLIVGNQGLNSQFKATEKEPLSLYYADFDDNGSVDPIFCYFSDGTSYPAASKDDLTEQLPMLKSKFVSYKSYSKATITDMFTPEQLKPAKVLKAEMLNSICLENTGGSALKLKPLPQEVQYAPIYAVGFLDINNDKRMDLVLAGNNSWTRIKFGQFTANHGTVLLGTEGKGFTCVPQRLSGLDVRGNVRSLEVMPTSGGASQLIFGINNAAVKTYQMKTAVSTR